MNSFDKTIIKKLKNHLEIHNSSGKFNFYKCSIIFGFWYSKNDLKEKVKNFKTGKFFAKIPKNKFFHFLNRFIIKSKVLTSSSPETSNKKATKKFIP